MSIEDGKGDFIFNMNGHVNHVVGWVTKVSWQFDPTPLFFESMRGNRAIIRPASSRLKIDISIIGEDVNIDGFDPRISRRVVRDCSIDELLFAIQHKIKEDKPPG